MICRQAVTPISGRLLISTPLLRRSRWSSNLPKTLLARATQDHRGREPAEGRNRSPPPDLFRRPSETEDNLAPERTRPPRAKKVFRDDLFLGSRAVPVELVKRVLQIQCGDPLPGRLLETDPERGETVAVHLNRAGVVEIGVVIILPGVFGCEERISEPADRITERADAGK